MQRRRIQIDNAWLIRILAVSGGWRKCEGCGGRMFVEVASGRCPVCVERERRHHLAVADVVQTVASDD